MAKATTRLGRGLSTLISPRATRLEMPPAQPDASHAPAETIRSIPIDRITPNPRQPRSALDDAGVAELADSIRTAGVLQPVLVRPLPEGGYELVAGERRWRAARLAGNAAIPAVVRDVTDAESLEIALIENLQRKDLSPLERAAAYQQHLTSFGGTVEELAKRLAESRANISNYIRLLSLPAEVRGMLASGQIAMGQARAIAGIDDPRRQLAIARMASRRNLSVRQVEDLARSSPQEADANAPDEDAVASESRRRHLTDIETILSRGVGLPVRIRPGRARNTGCVIIRYSSLDEFDRIAARLGADATLE